MQDPALVASLGMIAYAALDLHEHPGRVQAWDTDADPNTPIWCAVLDTMLRAAPTGPKRWALNGVGVMQAVAFNGHKPQMNALMVNIHNEHAAKMRAKGVSGPGWFMPIWMRVWIAPRTTMSYTTQLVIPCNLDLAAFAMDVREEHHSHDEHVSALLECVFGLLSRFS